jgi:hypothetical protein
MPCIQELHAGPSSWVNYNIKNVKEQSMENFHKMESDPCHTSGGTSSESARSIPALTI